MGTISHSLRGVPPRTASEVGWLLPPPLGFTRSLVGLGVRETQERGCLRGASQRKHSLSLGACSHGHCRIQLSHSCCEQTAWTESGAPTEPWSHFTLLATAARCQGPRPFVSGIGAQGWEGSGTRPPIPWPVLGLLDRALAQNGRLQLRLSPGSLGGSGVQRGWEAGGLELQVHLLPHSWVWAGRGQICPLHRCSSPKPTFGVALSWLPWARKGWYK